MRKIYLTLFVLLTLVFSQDVLAQKNGFIVKRADKFYNTFDFENALAIYKRANKNNSDNLYIQGRIGNCYKFLNEIQNSEEWYAPLANSEGVDPIYKFYYAQALMANGKYPMALEYANSYYEAMGMDDKKRYAYADNIFDEDEKYTIEIEDFNTKHADFSPFKIKDELYFISNRKEDAFLVRDDVWTHRPFTQIFRLDIKEKEESAKEDSTSTNKNTENNESKPKVFQKSDVSKWYHEGPIGWDVVLNDMYITRSNYQKRKPVKGDDKAINLKILKLAFNPEISDFGKMLVDNTTFSSKDYSVAYPSITVDGNYMVFASDMPGGFGGLDLYVATNIGGTWSNPINLGEKVNTPGNDAFPLIMPNGTMYFASNGHLGLGGLDIYSAELLEDGMFDYPVNLRSPINSPYDDFSFFINETFTEGYFTSNRPSEYGGDDIYSFQKKSFLFEAIVYDSKTEDRLLDATVTLIDLAMETELVLQTDAEGYVKADIAPNTRYGLKVEKEGYLPEEAEFTSAEDDVYAEIPLVKDYGIVLDVTVVDKDTKKELENATVTLIDISTEKEVTQTTNAYGKTSFVLDPDAEYRIKGDKELADPNKDYAAVSKDFNTFGTKAPANLFTVIELKYQELFVDYDIENIYYDLDKFYIRDDAALELNKIVKLLKDNPTMEIELSSHTDCRGSSKYNMWLSAKRAESAVNYLIENGIDFRRLTAAGYGETRLVNICACEDGQGAGRKDPFCTDLEHQKNRRTVFTILKF